jgi:hypothetical protein
VGGEVHIGEYVGLGVVHQGCQLGHTRAQLIGHLAPLLDEVLFGRRCAEEAIDAVCGRPPASSAGSRTALLRTAPRCWRSRRGSVRWRGTSANKRRTAHTPGSPPPEEGGQSDIPRHRARPAPRRGSGRSSALPEGAAPGRRPSAQKVAKADGRASWAGKRADQEKGHATEFGPMKQGGGRGKLRCSAASNPARASARRRPRNSGRGFP